MTALVIDEAQCLPDELLEEVRLLANIESASEKLLSIVLAGQPELATRLNQPSLRQLKQRIGLRCSLAPLDLPDTSGLHRRARPHRRRRGRAPVHARSGVRSPRPLGRHSADDQRDLRQRAGVGLCARSRADRSRSGSRGLRATSTSRTPAADEPDADRGGCSACAAGRTLSTPPDGAASFINRADGLLTRLAHIRAMARPRNSQMGPGLTMARLADALQRANIARVAHPSRAA